MRDLASIHEICQALEAAWSKHPALRLGQFLEAMDIFPTKIIDHQAMMLPFWQEDEETLRRLKK